MRIFAAVFLGGGLGAVLRYCTSEFFVQHFNNPIPLGTLAVNLVGGLLIGLLLPWFLATSTLAMEWRLLVITGLLGGLTTFSTFSYDTIGLLENSLLLAVTNIALNIFGSLSMTILGIYLSKKIIC